MVFPVQRFTLSIPERKILCHQQIYNEKPLKILVSLIIKCVWCSIPVLCKLQCMHTHQVRVYIYVDSRCLYRIYIYIYHGQWAQQIRALALLPGQEWHL